MAADVFRYAEESAQVYAGESITPELLRDGKYADGTVTYSLNKTIATVDENGTLTGENLGQLYLTAVLTQDGKQVKTTHILVTVCRKVSRVALDTKGLQVFEPDDETILPLLSHEAGDEPVTDKVLVLPVGKKFWPRATVLPEDVANAHKKVTFETSDGGKASVSVASLSLTISGTTLTVALQDSEDSSLSFPLSNLSRMYFSNTNETTGIEEITSDTLDEAADIYDLQGHKVSKDQMRRGVYIVKAKNRTYKIMAK